MAELYLQGQRFAGHNRAPRLLANTYSSRSRDNSSAPTSIALIKKQRVLSDELASFISLQHLSITDPNILQDFYLQIAEALIAQPSLPTKLLAKKRPSKAFYHKRSVPYSAGRNSHHAFRKQNVICQRLSQDGMILSQAGPGEESGSSSPLSSAQSFVSAESTFRELIETPLDKAIDVFHPAYQFPTSDLRETGRTTLEDVLNSHDGYRPLQERINRRLDRSLTAGRKRSIQDLYPWPPPKRQKLKEKPRKLTLDEYAKRPAANDDPDAMYEGYIEPLSPEDYVQLVEHEYQTGKPDYPPQYTFLYKDLRHWPDTHQINKDRSLNPKIAKFEYHADGITRSPGPSNRRGKGKGRGRSNLGPRGNGKGDRQPDEAPNNEPEPENDRPQSSGDYVKALMDRQKQLKKFFNHVYQQQADILTDLSTRDINRLLRKPDHHREQTQYDAIVRNLTAQRTEREALFHKEFEAKRQLLEKQRDNAIEVDEMQYLNHINKASDDARTVDDADEDYFPNYNHSNIERPRGYNSLAISDEKAFYQHLQAVDEEALKDVLEEDLFQPMRDSLAKENAERKAEEARKKTQTLPALTHEAIQELKKIRGYLIPRPLKNTRRNDEEGNVHGEDENQAWALSILADISEWTAVRSEEKREPTYRYIPLAPGDMYPPYALNMHPTPGADRRRLEQNIRTIARERADGPFKRGTPVPAPYSRPNPPPPIDTNTGRRRPYARHRRPPIAPAPSRRQSMQMPPPPLPPSATTPRSAVSTPGGSDRRFIFQQPKGMAGSPLQPQQQQHQQDPPAPQQPAIVGVKSTIPVQFINNTPDSTRQKAAKKAEKKRVEEEERKKREEERDVNGVMGGDGRGNSGGLGRVLMPRPGGF
ncbi:uncharacterized protein AB675_2830 [Cyphellophora attinorum]|uniref:Uncharacterized protein n=1 Tax=Cyphellophora attinorum TaxID=1664694 RepID=A0A0N0NRI8_9EURO|nr:uncharacterized protein AB675_2830 [Phialophora attinorum]KPI44899.1 hypothetical protein AB675_2830 [Phialophora attinorum]